MRKRWIAFGVLLGLCAAALIALVLWLPSARPRVGPVAAVPASERAALLAQLRPPKRARPLVAVLANNSGTETTDFTVPLGVLRESGVADVVAVAPRAEPVVLMPALRVRPDQDFAQFDAAHPDGADYVVVPALHHSDDPAVLDWLRAQARSGAIAVGICDGAWVLASAGLLVGHGATAHWFSRARLARSVPGMRWVPDRRYVADGRVVTTTGVSASLPASFTLVEAIAGRARAEELAAEFGVPSFGAEHESRAFTLDRPAFWTATGNWLARWRHETVELPLRDGVDEVALALTADAWARTWLASVRAVGPEQVTSARGLVLLADGPGAPQPAEPPVELPGPEGSSIDRALAAIDARYGPRTADFVALQLEYDRP